VTDAATIYCQLRIHLLQDFRCVVAALREAVWGLKNQERFHATAQRRNDRQKPGLTGSGM
jgi:hypothetical protein